MWLHPQQLLLCLLYYHTSKRAVPTSTPSPCTNINLEQLPRNPGNPASAGERRLICQEFNNLLKTKKNPPRNLYLLKHMPGSSMYFLCLDIIFSMCFFAFLPDKFCFSLKSVKHHLSLITAVLNFTNTGEVSWFIKHFHWSGLSTWESCHWFWWSQELAVLWTPLWFLNTILMVWYVLWDF